MSGRSEQRVVAGVGVILDYQGEKIPCLTRNISRGGLFVLLKRDLLEGENITVRIIHDEIRLTVPATIASVAQEGIGITFTKRPPGFKQAIATLLSDLVGTEWNEQTNAWRQNTNLDVAWTPLPDGKLLNWWKKRRRKAHLTNLSIDGGSLVSAATPEVGEEILLYLRMTDGQETQCRAEVIRQTDVGFAVIFPDPKLKFRQLIAEIRQLIR